MMLPCEICKYYRETAQDGHRVVVGCSDGMKVKGFKYDDFLYRHKCSEQEIREQCLNCGHREGIYCISFIAFENGECVDFKPINK